MTVRDRKTAADREEERVERSAMIRETAAHDRTMENGCGLTLGLIAGLADRDQSGDRINAGTILMSGQTIQCLFSTSAPHRR